ncbi:hypothetical protein [uncultured Methylobacterium sp.]|uniref:hypothetical protein n=1 Tax=uncultured Methylobacterium sp. TaxID=157278 RepID=UPI0035CBEA62
MAALNRLCPEPDGFSGASTAGATLPFLPTLLVAALLGVGALCWDSTEPAPGPAGPVVVASESSRPLPLVARMSIDPARPTPEVPRSLAALAFAAVFPVALEAPTLVVARAEARPPRRIVRIRPAPSGCPGPLCENDPIHTASALLRRPHVAAGTAPVPAQAGPFASAGNEADAVKAAFHGQTSSEQTSPEESLFDRALPFAPTLAPTIRVLQRTVGRTVGFVGSQAAAFGAEAAAIGTEATALCEAVTGLVGGLR